MADLSDLVQATNEVVRLSTAMKAKFNEMRDLEQAGNRSGATEAAEEFKSVCQQLVIATDHATDVIDEKGKDYKEILRVIESER